jgi:hypothetical protein
MINRETSTFAQYVSLTSSTFGKILAYVLETHALMELFNPETKSMKMVIINV